MTIKGTKRRARTKKTIKEIHIPERSEAIILPIREYKCVHIVTREQHKTRIHVTQEYIQNNITKYQQQEYIQNKISKYQQQEYIQNKITKYQQLQNKITKYQQQEII
jgi:hypothetical protein